MFIYSIRLCTHHKLKTFNSHSSIETMSFHTSKRYTVRDVSGVKKRRMNPFADSTLLPFIWAKRWMSMVKTVHFSASCLKITLTELKSEISIVIWMFAFFYLEHTHARLIESVALMRCSYFDLIYFAFATIFAWNVRVNAIENKSGGK